MIVSQFAGDHETAWTHGVLLVIEDQAGTKGKGPSDEESRIFADRMPLFGSLFDVRDALSGIGIAGPPTLGPTHRASGPPAVLLGDRDGWWDEPPDLNGTAMTSEIISMYGVETRNRKRFLLLGADDHL